MSHHTQPEAGNEIKEIHSKRYLLPWIENFTGRSCKFSHTSEMCMTPVSNKKYKAQEYYQKQSKSKLELRLNMIIDEHWHLTKCWIELDRSVNRPLMRKYS